MSDITQMLDRVQAGDPNAAEELLPLVYDELRRLAASKMSREAPGQTLQATELVHEAWLRLGGDQQTEWQNRAHFFAAASEAMRRILVERARRKHRVKRGSGVASEPLEEFHLEFSAPPDEVLKVDAALERFATEDAVAAQVVKLRYFVGLPVPKVAEVLQISPRTVDRLWAFARVRLKQLVENEK